MKKLLLDGNFLIISSVAMMVVMGVASVIPVFPLMAKTLHLGAAEIGLIITMFSIPGALLSPVAGVLADRVGRKSLLVPALLIFGIAGAACAFATDLRLLLALRFVQGVGVAPLAVLAVTLVGDRYEGKDLALAMGAYAGVQTAGLAVFPLLGGVLGVLDWRAPFLLPAVAVPLALIVWVGLESTPVKPQQALGPYLRGALVRMGALRVVAYLLATMVVYAIVFGAVLAYLPVLLAHQFGASPTTIGLVLSYTSACGAVVSFSMGRLERVLSASRLLVISCLLYAGALVMVPFVTSFWFILIPGTVIGLAQGLSFPSLVTAITRAAPHEYRAIYNATYGTMLRLGQAVGPGLMGAAHTVGGIDGVFYAGAALALILFVATAPLFWREEIRGQFVASGDRRDAPK